MKDFNELIRASEDILSIASTAKRMGWESVSEQSFHRILYLTKTFYAFKHTEDNIFDYFHFTVTTYGPHSLLVEKSVTFLASGERLKVCQDGTYCINTTEDLVTNKEKATWIKIILHILSHYGENRIFAFVINDPTYDEAVKTNRHSEIDSSAESKTVMILNSFKSAFESEQDSISDLSDEQYIDLYLDFLFSKIIK